MATAVAPDELAAGVRRSPFVGLEPYTEGDAAFFFGREREKRIVTANLRGARLTLFYGSSGVGKSSVLQAGVVHDLRARVAATAQTAAPGTRVPFAVTYFNAWRDDRPLGRLLEQIRRSAMEALGGERLPAWDGQRSPLDVLHEWTGRVRSLLVVLDQFEEYFLYHPDESGPGTFREEFAAIVNDSSLRVNFMLSIREDAWAKLDRFKGAVPGLFSNYLRLGPLDREAARRAIEGPVGEYNRRQAGEDGDYSIEPALIDSVLAGVESGTLIGDSRPQGSADAGGRAPVPAADDPEVSVETPYLQLVMERLWEVTSASGSRTLTEATLIDLGGPAEIVRGHLERAMGELTSDEQAVAAEAFRFLVTSSRTKVAQRVSDLADWTGFDEDRVAPVLERLSTGRRGRILRPLPPPPGEESGRYELFHDVLAEPILAWRRRFKKARDSEALAHKLEQEEHARLETERARHSARVNRLIRWGASALLLLTAALVVAVFAVIHERKVARSQGIAADAVGQLNRDPELGLLLAREAWKVQETPEAEDALRRALGASLVRGRIDTGVPIRDLVPTPNGRELLALTRRGVSAWSTADGRAIGKPMNVGTQFVKMEVSRDGTKVVAGGEGGAAVDSVRSMSAPVRLGPRETVYAVGVSADGRYAATSTDSGLTVWDARTGEEVGFAAVGPYDSLKFDPRNERRLVGIGCRGGFTDVVDWRTGSGRALQVPRGATRTGEADASACVAGFSPDGRKIATATNGAAAHVWDPRSGRHLGEVFGDRHGVNWLAWSRDGRQLALAAGKDVTIAEVGSRVGRRRVLAGPREDAVSLDFSADGRRLVSGSLDGTAIVYDTMAGRPLAELRGHTNVVWAAAFLGSTYRVATAGDDRTIRIWQTPGGRELGGQGDWVIEARYSPDGRRVAVAAALGGSRTDARARVWEPSTGRLVDLATKGTSRATTVDFEATGRRVLVAGSDGSGGGVVTVFDAGSGSVLKSQTVDYPVLAARFAPDGRQVVVGTDFGVRVVDRFGRGPDRVRNVDALANKRVIGVAYSPDGRLIAAGDGEGVVHLLDARTLKETKRLTGHGGGIGGIEFSADGERLVTSSSDRTGRVWNVDSGKTVAVLSGHTSWLSSAAFSPNGRLVATSGGDRTVRVWDARSGKLVGVESPHADVIDSVEFSPDGRSLLSSADDQSARITPCPTCVPADELLPLAATRLTRELTPAERRIHLDE